MKIVTIIGARPQFIKAAVVSRAIREYNRKADRPIQEIILHTGQHYDGNMSQAFFEELTIPEPDVNLGIGNAGHGSMTGRMIIGIEGILLEKKPRWVLIYGDTNSTLAGALAAAKVNIRLAHVEAGLRSFNMRMPEEQNRIVADRLSNLLFCPTRAAVANLRAEGIGDSPYGEQVQLVGDVMFDGALFYSGLADDRSTLLEQLSLPGGRFVLATLHRAENTDDPKRLKDIVAALSEIAESIPVVLPLHPRTKKLLEAYRLQAGPITLLEPLSYLDMICLERNCQAILTDSGGVQKEAYFFSKPCITLRDETEWIELVDAGVNILTGADRVAIVSALHEMMRKPLEFGQRFYGDGNAANRIIEGLLGSTV